jgi:hypothetical protein
MTPRHDFSRLYAFYPDLIAQMPATFSSHEFFLYLAHQHQDLYVEALYSYRDALRRGRSAPFLSVHSVLGKQLSDRTDLVERVGSESRPHIFGQVQAFPLWRRR